MKKLAIKHLVLPVVQAQNLCMRDQDIVLLSGPSGSGKSMLLRAIVDLDPHDDKRNTILLDQQNQLDFRPQDWRSRIAYVPSESAWWADIVGLHFRDLHSTQTAARIKHVGFEADIENWQISRLSSGERQRLALVRALQNEPEVLLLDEITANLDRQNEAIAIKMIDKYVKAGNRCALWVSHQTQEIAELCNHVWQIDNQRVTVKP